MYGRTEGWIGVLAILRFVRWLAICSLLIGGSFARLLLLRESREKSFRVILEWQLCLEELMVFFGIFVLFMWLGRWFLDISDGYA